jgi:hypothetical protein
MNKYCKFIRELVIDENLDFCKQEVKDGFLEVKYVKYSKEKPQWLTKRFKV